MRYVSKESMFCVFRSDGIEAATKKSITGEVGKCLEPKGQNFHPENTL